MSDFFWNLLKSFDRNLQVFEYTFFFINDLKNKQPGWNFQKTKQLAKQLFSLGKVTHKNCYEVSQKYQITCLFKKGDALKAQCYVLVCCWNYNIFNRHNFKLWKINNFMNNFEPGISKTLKQLQAELKNPGCL